MYNKENLQAIIDYLIDDETRHYEEEFDCEVNTDNPTDFLRQAEENDETDHILYRLMVLQKELNGN